MSPKVSIVIPVYNVEEYLRECLDSVVNQTLKEIEIVCVDDGSKDKSGAILDEYAVHDSRFKVIHKENGGYGKAMNVGIDAATGEYIGIVEPDDYIEVSMFETLYKKAAEFDLDLIKSDFRRFWHENGQLKFKREVLDKSGRYYGVLVDLTQETEPYKFPMNTWCGIYRRSYLNEYHIRHHETPGASFQDNGFWMQTFWHAKRAMFIPDRFYNNRRDNPNSSVSNPAKVFCINSEYDWIKGLLEQDSELKSRFLGIYFLKKYHNYMFTFRRVSQKFKKLFLKTFSQEFKEDKEKNELDLSQFSDGEKKVLDLIIRHPMKFYRQELNRPSLLEKIFSVRNNGDKKVIRILGFKIKYRTAKLVYKTLKAEIDHQAQNFNSRLNNLNGKYQSLIYKLFEYCPDERREAALKDWYFESTGELLSLENPQTFNEKVQWLKLFGTSQLKTALSDKYSVRDWVKEKAGEKCLIPLLGAWDNAADIDFDKLPDQFVLKCNHGCGYAILVPDKSKLNKENAIWKLNRWLNEDYSFRRGFEIQYSGIKRKIIAEEYISGVAESKNLYRVFCVNGKVRQIWQDTGKGTPEHKVNIYDQSWQELNVNRDAPAIDESISPDARVRLSDIAGKISSGLDFVCIYFYVVNDTIYFGGMSFTPTIEKEFSQYESVFELGSMIDTTKDKSPISEK